MNTLELLDKKELLKKRAEEIISGAKKEVRKLNAGEQVEFDTLTKEVADIDIQIRKIEEDNLKQTTHTTNTMKEKFSLLKAINDVANNRQLDERAQEVVGAGIAEMRKAGQSYSGQIVLPIEERADIQATVATAGQENVAEDKLGILEPLRASLVLAQAGASYKQFLIQDSNSAEEMLKRDIVSAISNKLEATILGTAAGSATQPAGLLNGVTADTAAVTYTDFVNMEATLGEKNVRGDIKFIVSPSAKAVLKSTAKNQNSFIMEGNEVNGYPVLCTSAVAGKGIVYGNFADLVIGQWGGIDLTVDPYTQAANGKVRLVINAYFDAKPRRAEAFVKKVLKA